MKTRPYFVFLGLLCSLYLFPMKSPFSSSIDSAPMSFLQAIPYEIKGWKGVDVPVDERTYEILETRSLVSRFYKQAKGEAVHLLVIASDKDRRVAHPPQVCYVSSNYAILNEKEDRIEFDGKEISLKGFVAQNQKDSSDEQKVIYVYKVGKRFTTSYYAQQLQFTWDRFTRQESRVLLIRVSGTNTDHIKKFLSEVLPYLF